MNLSRIRHGLPCLFLATLAAFVGCGGETPDVAAIHSPAEQNSEKAEPAVTPTPTPVAKPADIKPAPDPIPAKKLSINPFQMPDIPEEFLPAKEEAKPVEQAAPEKQVERPRLRLLGFVNVDGFKALVESKGDVKAVAVGESIEGVKIVSIEQPNVTFQYASARWSTKLFEQPWHNEQTGVASSPSATRAFTSQSRSTPRSSSVASSTRTSTPSTSYGSGGLGGPSMPGGGMGGGMPGIGGASGMPSIPGMNSGDGGSGIPGLGSIPGMPSGGGAGAMPGGGGAMPGGGGAMPGGGGAMPGGGGAMPGGGGAMPGGGGAMPGGGGAMPGGGGAMPGGGGAMPGGGGAMPGGGGAMPGGGGGLN